MEYTAEQAQLIAQFCKSTKASKAKTQEMLSAFAATMPAPVHVGRKPTEAGAALRTIISSMRGSGRQTTAKALAQEIGFPPANVYLMLRAWGKPIGKAEKPAGVRGKSPMIFEL